MTVDIQKWMLPDGVIEALPRETEVIDYLENVAISTFASWGFKRVRPPIMEYLDSLINNYSKMNGLLDQTIQFKDQVSGKQLGIRADITPQVARIDSYYLKTNKISRYAYSGEVVRSYPINHKDYRNPTITGVELFGSYDIGADIEVISLLIYYLEKIKIKPFIVDLGDVSIAQLLLNSFKLKEARSIYYFGALENKDYDALMDLAKADKLTDEQYEKLIKLTRLNGDISILNNAKQVFEDDKNILDRLDMLFQIVNYLINILEFKNINIDLSDVRGYGYHNGFVFSAYKEGEWKVLAQGGRYEQNLLEDGNNINRAGIGFSCDLHVLAAHTLLPKNEHKVILCRLPQSKSLNKLIKEYRENAVVIIGFDQNDVFENYTHEIVLDHQGNYQLISL